MNVVLSVRRGHGRLQFPIEAPDDATVLDALELIRAAALRECEHPGQALRFRHSCHHGSCGTCGALINGQPRLMCLARISELGGGAIELDPLPGETLIGDIAVEPSSFFDSLPDFSYLGMSARSGVEAPPELAPLSPYGERAETIERERFEDCIECGLCVAACPVTNPGKAAGVERERRAFSGPAALAMAHREISKSGPRSKEARTMAEAPDGVAACERAFACSRVCPRGVAPGRRIEALRRG